MPAFGHFTLAEITTEMISDYRESRLKVVKPATLYQEISLLRRMFNVARREWKWINENPAADLSFSIGNSNARDRWLSFAEEQRLLSAATNPNWLRSLIVTALHTGMRRGEILNLQLQDMDLQRKLLTVHKSKNGEKRAIPLSSTLCDVLRGIKVLNISGKVFPISVRSLRAAFEITLEKTAIKDFHFHDLRHTFATRLVQAGVDFYRVKELLGRKTINMIMRYAHHYPESLRSSIDVLDKTTTILLQSAQVLFDQTSGNPLISIVAGVVELADAPDSKYMSNPLSGAILYPFCLHFARIVAY